MSDDNEDDDSGANGPSRFDAEAVRAGSKDQTDLYTMNPLDYISKQFRAPQNRKRNVDLSSVKEDVQEEDRVDDESEYNPFEAVDEKQSDESSCLQDLLDQGEVSSDHLSNAENQSKSKLELSHPESDADDVQSEEQEESGSKLKVEIDKEECKKPFTAPKMSKQEMFQRLNKGS